MTFREYYFIKYQIPYPANNGEETSIVLSRIAEALADWADLHKGAKDETI